MWDKAQYFLSRHQTRLAQLAPVMLILALVFVLRGAAAQSDATEPTFTIEAVVVDTSVTVQTQNFPPNQDFVVRMGPNGTLGVGGEVVGITNSGSNGLFRATYPIPVALRGAQRIAIRMESPQGTFSYNWFDNNLAPVPQTGTPSFKIESVVINESVTIETRNFPPDREFLVLMGPNGTLGVNGYPVGIFKSGPGGKLSVSFPIPKELKGLERISIRAESGPYFAYNWFDNQPIEEVRTPTMRICAVVRDQTVTIQTGKSFPTNREFAILMGPMGTNGVNGYVTGTLNSGPEGSVAGTFPIPAGLRGLDQISIRADEINGPYFSFNYFNNQNGVYCQSTP